MGTSLANPAEGQQSSMSRVDPDHLGKRSSSTFVEDPSGRILFMRRTATDPWKPLKWDIPGGGVDRGETASRAARREAREESGISLDYLELLTVQRMGNYARAIFFAELPFRPRVSFPDGEHDRFLWLTPREALKLPMIPGLKKAVRQFLL